MSNKNGWSEYQKLVLHRLDSLDSRVSKIEDRLTRMDTHIVGLRWKAKTMGAIFGAMAGCIPIIMSWVLSN